MLQTLRHDNWSSFREQWDSYSIQSYLNKVNLSRSAIDYINIFRFLENNPSIALLEFIRSLLIFGNSTKFYMIAGGNDLLIRAMVEECQEIESNRCSIVYSTPITQIQLYDPNQVRWTTKNGTSHIFNTIIVATTAPAAQLIDFYPRIDFINKYRTLRQVNYVCATKILLSFNVSWWYTQENLSGGQSITDLNIRNVYYPSVINNQTNGGTMLVSYTSAQDTLVWQSLSESDAIELTLKQLIQLHRSSSNMRDFFQGGKIQNWCEDPYSHGAFTGFVPLQETKLVAELQAAVSNIHFIGEYTSYPHAWVEGALVSAIRAALTIAEKTETIFDVIIVGGNPIGLATAIFLSLKQPGLRIVIVEKDVITNADGSSGTFDQQQFRQMFNEEYLVELANMSFSLWRQIEQLANMSLGSVLNTNDGFLFWGDPNANRLTFEGNLVSIKRTCENLQMDCEYLNNTQLQTRYPMFTFPRQYEGIFHNRSGYINVTMLMMALLRIIARDPNIIIRQQERFLSLQLNDQTKVVTDRGVLHASRKVLFVPGPHVKNISRLLNFDLNITLWELPVYYFRRLPNVTRLPTWFAWDGNDLQSLFSGFPIDWTSDYISISPNFIANMSNPLMYPSQQTNTIDPALTQKVIDWVSRHLGTLVNVSDYYSNNRTKLSTFLPDNGFVLDYVPRTNRRVLMQAAGWGMDFIPIWADILSNMILFEINTSSQYSKYIGYFSLSRPNRLIEGIIKSDGTTEGAIRPNKGQQMISSFLLFLCCLFILLH
jgi:glycine/D-amino acid oxidase-like deaminating enzyme